MSAKKGWGIKLISHNKRYIYTLAFAYSAVVVVLVSIPAFFYIQVEKENFRHSQLQELQHYAYGVEKSIYDFSRTKEKIFDFPRSVLYNAYLYGVDGKLIFSTNGVTKGLADFENSDIIAKRIVLNSNRLKARYLVIEKPFSYRAIYAKALIVALFLGAVIFFMTLFFIRISMQPLERLNRYLNTFFNDAMHELKTPLGVMQLNMEMLPKAQESRALRRLRNAMHNIILIYEDIEYHIKQDHVAYRPEKIDCSHFLRERVELFRDLATVKSITIVEEIEINIEVEINRIELQRIIDNTLSNAIKYSLKETTIHIKLKEKEGSVLFSVQDEGIGIADKRRVFERYHRENSVQGGFGLGLSIVKHICDKNGIEIVLKSSPGNGSTFTYILNKNR